MEGYQNYQEVINAIKAEYVNARNLKKSATAKKRVATNAKSFKTRKEGEKTSLETKLIAVKSDLDSTLSIAINNLEDSKFDLLKSELSELEGKLAFIDADIARLDRGHTIDPDNIGSTEYVAKTSTESQTLSVLRIMLQNTVNDAKNIIQNLYEGQDYNAIKTATVPTLFTDTEQEVVAHYQDLKTTYDGLLDKVKVELEDFITSIFATGATQEQSRINLINDSQYLVELKSQLATLLEDQAPESSINAQEQQIDSHKTQMLHKAADLKESENWLSSGLQSDKLTKLKKYATDLSVFTNELESYRWQNSNFLITQFEDPRRFTSWATFDMFEKLFELLNNDSVTRNLLRGQNYSEFKVIYDQILEAKSRLRDSSREGFKNHDLTDSLLDPNQIFDCTQRYNGNNGNIYENVVGFKDEVSKENKEFYVNASSQIVRATNEYMYEKVKYDTHKGNIQQSIWGFQGAFSDQMEYLQALKTTKRNWRNQDFYKEASRNGDYHGTQEQINRLNEARQNLSWTSGSKDEKELAVPAYVSRFNLYNGLFPEFYSTLSTLRSNQIDLYNTWQSTETSLAEYQNQVNSAYDYLRTLNVGETQYIVALGDYEAKVASFEPVYAEWLNMMNGPGGSVEAYDFLQTTLAGEASYQAAVIDLTAKSDARNLLVVEANNLQNALNNALNARNSFTEGTDEYSTADADYIAAQTAYESFNNEFLLPATTLLNEADALVVTLIPSHYIYIGAQSDYDTKLAAKDTYYADIVTPVAVLRNDAYTFLQDLADEDAAYQSALTDWTNKLNFFIDYRDNTNTPASQAYSNSGILIDNHSQGYYGNEFNMSLSGYDLIQILSSKDYAQEEAQQTLDSYNAAYSELQSATSEMTFVESTPFEKRESLKMQLHVDRLEQQFTRFYGLVTENIHQLNDISQEVIYFAGTVRDRDLQGFGTIHNNLMDFLSSSDERNLFARNLRRMMYGDLDGQKLSNLLRNFIDPVLKNYFNFDAPFNKLASTDWQTNIVGDLSTSNGIDSLINSVRQLNDSIFRGAPGEWFADKIINEVNNGTPLI